MLELLILIILFILLLFVLDCYIKAVRVDFNRL